MHTLKMIYRFFGDFVVFKLYRPTPLSPKRSKRLSDMNIIWSSAVNLSAMRLFWILTITKKRSRATSYSNLEQTQVTKSFISPLHRDEVVYSTKRLLNIYKLDLCAVSTNLWGCACVTWPTAAVQSVCGQAIHAATCKIVRQSSNVYRSVSHVWRCCCT